MVIFSCTSVDLSTSLPVYGQKHSFLFAYNSGIFGKVYMFLNGVSSKFLACFFLPILTLLRIVELKRTEKMRQAKNFSKASSSGYPSDVISFHRISDFQNRKNDCTRYFHGCAIFHCGTSYWDYCSFAGVLHRCGVLVSSLWSQNQLLWFLGGSQLMFNTSAIQFSRFRRHCIV